MTLEGRTCLITGAGRGLGAETARFLASEGADLALCSRTQSEVQALAAELEVGGTRVFARAVDVADAAAVEAFVDESTSHLGTPFALINNAAVLGPVGPLTDCDLEEWRCTLEVDLFGVVHTSASCARRMAGAGEGVIVNLSGGGIGGPRVAPRITAYTTAKAAVVHLTETLALELESSGIRVNALAPGAMATGFTAPVLEAGPAAAGERLYRQTQENQQAGLPVGPFTQLLRYVLSDEAAWLSGCLLSANWDTPEALRARRQEIAQSSLLRLRRIDGDLFLDRALGN